MSAERRNKVLMWSLLIAAPIFTCGLIGALVFEGLGGRGILGSLGRVDQTVEEYRALGWPWESHEIDALVRCGDGENAQPILTQVLADFPPDGLREDKRLIVRALAAGDPSSVGRILAPYEKTLNQLAPVMNKPCAYFAHDYDHGYSLDDDEVYAVREAAIMLSMRAEYRAMRGSVPGAIDDLALAAHVSNFVTQQPTHGGQLMGCAAQLSILSAVEHVLPKVDRNVGQLRLIKSRVVDALRPPSVEMALRQEAYSGISFLRNKSILSLDVSDEDFWDQETDPDKVVRTGVPADQMSRANLVAWLEVWTKFDQLLKEHPDRPGPLASYFVSLDETHANSSRMGDLSLKMLIPDLDRSVNAIYAIVTRIRLVKLLLDAMIVRAETRRFPARIADITGDWRDPFSEDLFQYHLKGDTLTVYSVSIDGVDHGGKRRQQDDEDDAETDIVVSYPRARSTR